MISKRYLPLIVVMMTAVVCSTVSTARSQAPDDKCQYFPETDLYVCEPFLEFYQTRGGLEIFGHPITAAFDDPGLALHVQYFQKARMEWHPENSPPYQVQLGLLAQELGHIHPPAPADKIPPFNNDLHHYFPETGHIVEYAFLDYFRQKGGLDIFGYPLSEFMFEDGRIVQYFQRVRMEWYPENPPGSQIHLTLLGETYVDVNTIDDHRNEGAASIISPVTKLNVSASVRYVITGRDGGQTVFVYVTDQREEPVAGAVVSMDVAYPSGDVHYEFEQPTDGSGFAGHYFDILSSAPGQKVVIIAKVTYGDLTETAQTFFLPWW
jgi:hypothetical protein